MYEKDFAKAFAMVAERGGFRIILEPMQASEPAQGRVREPVKETTLPAEEAVKTAQNGTKEAFERESWVAVSTAARLMGINKERIYRRIRAGVIQVRLDEKGNMQVNTEILSGLPNKPAVTQASPSKKRGWSRKGKELYCFELGRCFKSYCEAAKAFHVSMGTVRYAVTHNKLIDGKSVVANTVKRESSAKKQSPSHHMAAPGTN